MHTEWIGMELCWISCLDGAAQTQFRVKLPSPNRISSNTATSNQRLKHPSHELGLHPSLPPTYAPPLRLLTQFRPILKNTSPPKLVPLQIPAPLILPHLQQHIRVLDLQIRTSRSRTPLHPRMNLQDPRQKAEKPLIIGVAAVDILD